MRKLHLVLIAFGVVALAILTWTPIPTAQAQFAGANAFQIPFTIVKPAAARIIPPCIATLPTAAVPCIPNHNQVGHTITYKWDTGFSICSLTLDGSNDNTIWASLTGSRSDAAGSINSGMSYANGYFTYLRIRVSACATGTLTGVYTGYAVPLPNNPVTQNVSSSLVQTPKIINTFPNYYNLDGYQCFNPNSTVATSSIVFTGAGLNDLTKSGTYSCSGGRIYIVQIDSTGTPDTFRWGNNGGGPFTSGVAITAGAQALECGLSVTFGATTGHTLNNFWTFNATDGTAYLQLFSVTAPPSLGTTEFYEVGIPRGQTIVYPGPPLAPFNNVTGTFAGPSFFAGAATTPGGTTAVGMPLDCSFQFSNRGSFYPYLPASP